ncbi:hypothetical protein, partial [Holdemania filiformis]|uniref:hypothetical protein n=1 Tax=Holdemania filiformis TaxID=61171 RepID=UPI001AD82DC7
KIMKCRNLHDSGLYKRGGIRNQAQGSLYRINHFTKITFNLINKNRYNKARGKEHGTMGKNKSVENEKYGAFCIGYLSYASLRFKRNDDR